MDRSDPIPFPSDDAAEQLERTLAEIDGAIELVVRGDARTIYLTGLARIEQAAPLGAARAQRSGVRFRVEGEPGTSLIIVVGPRRAQPLADDA